MLLVVLAIQGRTVVVFPRFLRFFLRFLSEVVVFPRFFKDFFFVFFLKLKEFFLIFFLLRFHRELHHLCKHFFKVFHFFSGGGKFF